MKKNNFEYNTKMKEVAKNMNLSGEYGETTVSQYLEKEGFSDLAYILKKI